MPKLVTFKQVLLVILGLASMAVGGLSLYGPLVLITLVIAVVCWSIALWSWAKDHGYVDENDKLRLDG